MSLPYAGDSDSEFTRGFLSLLIRGLEGLTPDQIAEVGSCTAAITICTGLGAFFRHTCARFIETFVSHPADSLPPPQVDHSIIASFGFGPAVLPRSRANSFRNMARGPTLPSSHSRRRLPPQPPLAARPHTHCAHCMPRPPKSFLPTSSARIRRSRQSASGRAGPRRRSPRLRSPPS